MLFRILRRSAFRGIYDRPRVLFAPLGVGGRTVRSPLHPSFRHGVNRGFFVGVRVFDNIHNGVHFQVKNTYI